MTPTTAIQVRDLDFAYAARGEGFRLHVARLELELGELAACIGPSGSGKTTLLHLLTGVIRPSPGRATVLGRDVGAMGEAQRRQFRLGELGLVFQEFELLEYVSARENVLLASALGGADRRTLEARLEVLAERAGVAHVLAREPAHLSQGERQRVAVCRALVTRPRLIVCDEPTGNLDPSTTARVVDLILEEAAEIGAAVLMVTHNHGLLGRFERVIDLASLREGAV